MDGKTIKILKNLIKEGYALKCHHTFKFTDIETGNVAWKNALEAGEQLLVDIKNEKEEEVVEKAAYREIDGVIKVYWIHDSVEIATIPIHNSGDMIHEKIAKTMVDAINKTM